MLYNKTKHWDFTLIIFTALACFGGILLVFSLVETNAYQTVSNGVSTSMWKTKIVAMIIGFIGFIVLSALGIEKIACQWKWIGSSGILLTALTFTPLGVTPVGTDDKAWLSFAGFTIQPAEVLKLCFIITFATHIYSVKSHFNKPQTILGLLGHAAIPILIVCFQGDQGTALVFVVIAIAMLFAGGLSWKYIVSALAASPIVVLICWKWLLLEHQKQRILVLFNPELDPWGTGYQQSQGLEALQSGGIFGKGLFSGEKKDFVYVSESQNDFIFSYAGQTLGFVGCGIIILILFVICIRLVSDSAKASPLGSSVCAGVFGLIFAHTFINIGMVLGFMPVIGIPLPFFSAGGTAMVTMLVAIGLAQASLKNSHNKKSNQS